MGYLRVAVCLSLVSASAVAQQRTQVVGLLALPPVIWFYSRVAEMESASRTLLAAVLVWCVSAALASAQTAPGAVVLDPAPDIAGVIKGATRPQVVVRGLRSADDPLWLPGIGLVFTESANNRIVRLGDDGQVTTFIGDLHGPLGQTVDRQGRLISLQTQEGFRGPRVVWPRVRRR
jgi:hypothetical protein